MDLATKSLKYLTNFKWDIEDGAQLSWDRRYLAYTLNENGLSGLHVLETQGGKELSVPKLPAGTINDLRWHENNRDLAFSLNSAQSPADVYSVDLQSHKLERWTHSETGGINPQSFAEPNSLLGRASMAERFRAGCIRLRQSQHQGNIQLRS